MAQLKSLLVNGQSRFIDKVYASDQIISNVAQGTAPFGVDSSTLVTNLNADLLDGKHASEFSLSTHNHDDKYLKLAGGWMDWNAQIYFKGYNNSTTVYSKIGYATSASGQAMHCINIGGHQANGAFYITSNGSTSTNDTGGIAIDNEGVTIFGAGDAGSNFTGIFRVLNEDNVADGPQFIVTKASGATTKYSHRAQRFISTVAQGTAPIQVTSTTLCSSLNADLLDGYHAADFRNNIIDLRATPDTFNPTYLKDIVFLSEEDYSVLLSNGSINRNGVAHTYNKSNWYITDKIPDLAEYAHYADFANKVTLADTGNTNVTYYPVFAKSDSSVGDASLYTDAGLSFNASTNNLIVSGSLGLGISSPENKLDVNGIASIYPRGEDNTLFRGSLIIKQQNSLEGSNGAWDETKPSFGIQFNRFWTAGTSAYGETPCAGIFATVSSSWRAGLVFRTKNNTTSGGTHDISALTLMPSGIAKLHGRTDTANYGYSSFTADNSALQIREYNYGGAQTDTWGYAPRMSWVWNGRSVNAQIGLASSGYLYLSYDSFATKYKLVYETGTWGISISGNAATATATKTITRSTNAVHYLTFVDSDNSSATAENFYTSSKITMNPGTGEFKVTGSVYSTAEQTTETYMRAKGGDIYAGSATTAQCHMKYDATDECMKFIFD